MGSNGKSDDQTSQSLSYKYQRLREQLRTAITDGTFTGKLPGERALAKRYSVNAKTINKALCDLTMEGLLIRHVGRGTFVAGTEGPLADTSTRTLTFGWIAGASCSGCEDLYSRAQAVLSEQGHSLKKIPVTLDSDYLPESALSPGQLRELAGLILYKIQPSVELLAALYRRHLPVVIANNRHDVIRTRAVVPDYSYGTFELTRHLLQLGHERIQLIIDAGLLPAAEDAIAGYASAVPADMKREPIQTNPDAMDWDGVFQGSDRPSAIISVGCCLAAEALGQAKAAGLTIPTDISIATVCGPGSCELDHPDLTIYETAPGRIAEAAAKLLLIASPGEKPPVVILPGKLHLRATTGPWNGQVPAAPSTESDVVL